MIRVYAVVEGHTEVAFFRGVMAPYLGEKNVFVVPILLGKPQSPGGNVSIQRLRGDIVSQLRRHRESVCTTMFDYYGLPFDFPGKDRVMPNTGSSDKAESIESALRSEIKNTMGPSFDIRRFVPYVQMHEFEGLLFSDPTAFARSLHSPKLEPALKGIRDGFGTPEDINDNVDTAPSKRIARLRDEYKKISDGLAAAKAIGLEEMRKQCPHFSAWVAKLESLGDKA